ncbi:MAG: hypothetical protein QOF40_632 [Actinomycetota bacterium]|nr:hypothetical protein [Actinomycetota bacterium]
MLTGTPARDPVTVVERLLAIQAQDLRGARLAVRARSRGLTTADLDQALGTDRAVVVTWLNRGTLHLVQREDYWWLHALTAPTIRTGNARRLEQEGHTPKSVARGTRVIVDALAADGPLSRDALAERLRAAGVRTEGQALIHLLLHVSLDGLVVRGPIVGDDQAYALTRDWLGPAPPVDRDRALAELARRYLAGHGPADDRDLAKWSGLPLRDARAGLRAIADEITERPDGRADRKGRRRVSRLPRPRLLGQFDPILHGWRSRAEIVGDHHGIVTVNGIFRPIALVDGVAAATWGLTARALTVRPFHALGGAETEALGRDGADVLRYLCLADRPVEFEEKSGPRGE